MAMPLAKAAKFKVAAHDMTGFGSVAGQREAEPVEQ